MRFVLEHSLSARLAVVVEAVETEHDVRHLKQLYPPNTADSVWLKGLAQLDPEAVVITADPRIRTSPQERAAWLESGLTVFFLKSFADLPLRDQAVLLLRTWPKIVQAAAAAPAGSGFFVTVQGKILPAD